MTFRPLALIPVIALTISAHTAHAAPNVTSFTLENGMQGVVIEDNRAPVVTHMVWYKVGAADEPPGKSGIAHYLEHLMFKGTDEIPKGAFSKIIAENGGQDNAFTSLDYTGYYQSIASDRLDLVMKMEADRMVDLRLSDDVTLPERDVILEERNQRTENDPGALFSEQMDATLYMSHPYSIPIVGWKKEIQQLTTQDALDFYATHYAPDNAILVVAGDVAADEVKRLAEIHYGAIPAAGIKKRMRPVEPPHRAARRLQMSDERVRQPYVMRRYLVPSRATGGDDQAAALSMFAQVLGGGGVTSRLSKELTQKQRITINTGAFYRGQAYDDGVFTIYGVPAPGVSLDQVEAELDKVMDDLIANGPTADELNRAKSVIRASEIYAQDSQAGLARRYGAGLTAGLTVERIQSWVDTLTKVTPEDVMTTAANEIRLEASVTGWLLEKKKEADQ